MKQFEKLAEFCNEQNIVFDEATENNFSTFYDLLVEKNKVMNLTAVTDQDEVEMRHFIDSLEAKPVFEALRGGNKSCRIADVGTGAGFPGLPLAIVSPEDEFLLMDSLNKRIGFINEVLAETGITNVTALQTRAEDAGQGEFRESFDFCVSRAVANTSVLLEYMLPLVKVGGHAILYKSGEFEKELEEAAYAMDTLGGSLKDIIAFQLPGSDIGRSLIVIEKIQQTPGKYPRKAGKPTKSPLVR